MAEEDIIFGKNRHFFGGIEPSNIVSFTAAPYGNHVRLSIILPEDTVIDGQSLCTVAGVVIRKSLVNYPADEFDGELLADLRIGSNRSIMYDDADAEATGTYYYAAFPYTMQGVYNRSHLNRCAYNEPGDMVKFEAKSAYNYETDIYAIDVTATIPENVTGVVIMKSTSAYPESEIDGDEFMTITESGIYSDTDVTDSVTYFYAAFPYTSTGAYNRNSANRTFATACKYKWLYGYDLDTTDSDPDTRVSYPEDVMNANYNHAYMDSSTERFNYGDWDLTPGEGFMPRPCMLKYDGTVGQYLDPNDYTKQEDGLTASDVSNLSYEGNAMMEWPKIYTKRWEDDGIYHFRCSDNKLGDDWDCWCNYDKNDNEIDHFYTAIYNSTLNESKARSISGQPKMHKGTEVTVKSYITANGSDWYRELYADRLLILDLLTLMIKTTDGQTAIPGCGAGSDGTGGGMNSKGMFWGSNGLGVKVFGMEDFWGGNSRYISGLNIHKASGLGTYYDLRYKITIGKHDGSDTNNFESYSQFLTGGRISGHTYSSCFITDLETTKFGRVVIVPSTNGSGSRTTYECDYFWYDTRGADTTYFARCGDGSDGTGGPFYTLINMATNETNFQGTVVALSCKPSLKEV